MDLLLAPFSAFTNCSPSFLFLSCTAVLHWLSCFFFSRYAIHNSGISFSVKKVCKWSRYNFTIYISAYETSDRTVNWLIVLSGLFSKAILCQMLELYQTLPQWTTLGPSLEMLLAGMLMSSFIWTWSFIVYLSLSSLLKNASCANSFCSFFKVHYREWLLQ